MPLALVLVLELRGELLVTLPRRLRAPKEHGAVLAEPPLADAEALVALNRRRLASFNDPLLGRSWSDLRRQARQAAVAAAKEYLQRAGEPVAAYNDDSLLMAGHQPELFHPGVWVKNFALNGLARNLAATPINLIVDNDTAKATSLRVPALGEEGGEVVRRWGGGSRTPPHRPTPSPHHPTTSPPHHLATPPPQHLSHVASIPFDDWTGEVPYEERTVNDEALFASLPDRVAPHLKDWGFVPLLFSFWEQACRQAERTPLLGERIVAARRAIERGWGCHNLELPVSQLCRTEPFAHFACHLLTHLPRFHAVYNDCVHAYRQQYGIRSRNHPVPDLARQGDWLETPFWAWRTGQKERQRLFARRTEPVLFLRAGADVWPELPTGTDRDPSALVREWQELERRGFKVRSRALTNTLFARLFLVDLFIHGIGGAKYDELTDEIAHRFYGSDPPRYLILSATLLLPLPAFPANPVERQHLARELRDHYYNPQRHLENGELGAPSGGGSSVHVLAADKEAWIRRQAPNKNSRRERFHALRALTEKMRDHLAGRLSALEQELARYDQQLQTNAVLLRRHYAFCLYPEAMLRSICTQFLQQRS
jgi:hypothetical protein